MFLYRRRCRRRCSLYILAHAFVRVCVFYFGESVDFGCVAAVAFADVAVIAGAAVCFTFNMDVWKFYFSMVIVK